MELMAKVNRAINKKGWSYTVFNNGNQKEIEVYINVSHKGKKYDLKLNLISRVSIPSYGEYVGFVPEDVKYEEKVIVYETPSRICGYIHDLKDPKIEDWDYTKITSLDDARELISWSTDDLFNATERRIEALKSFAKEYCL